MSATYLLRVIVPDMRAKTVPIVEELRRLLGSGAFSYSSIHQAHDDACAVLIHVTLGEKHPAYKRVRKDGVQVIADLSRLAIRRVVGVRPRFISVEVSDVEEIPWVACAPDPPRLRLVVGGKK